MKTEEMNMRHMVFDIDGTMINTAFANLCSLRDAVRHYTGKDCLETGAFGIEEPSGENFTDFDEIELGIIPGVSFDRQGNRLGRGKGYYDKLLPLLPHSYNIGICYRFQAREEIPAEPFDKRMDEVWTEEGRWS